MGQSKGMPKTQQPWLHDLVTVLSAPTTVLSESSGQIRAAGAQGVLHADSRALSAAVLEVGGEEPVPLSSGLLDAGRALFTGLVRHLGDDAPDPAVRVERERSVGPGWLRERIRLVSVADVPVATDVTLRVAADLATLGEIRTGQGRPAASIEVFAGNWAVPRSPAGQPAPDQARAAADTPVLSWSEGPVQVRLTAPGAAAAALPDDTARLTWPVELTARGQAEVTWELAVSDPAAVVGPPPGGTRDLWPGVRADGDDPRLGRLLARALPDAGALLMATSRDAGEEFLGAGSPWFLTLFGRDSLWAAQLLLPFGWPLAASTLRALAARQGRRVDPATSEAPGKILHELRTAGRQGAGGLPARYYGTIDATSLWICLLHDAWRWGMPEDQVRPLLPSLAAALAFQRDYADADGDGLLEYIDASGRGLANQGWKDSADAVRFADGTIADPPVALCEVQGYAYEAARHGADLMDALGVPGAGEWRDWAARLAEVFRARFWVADGRGPYPALALDARKQPVDSVTSNIGHLLGTGLLTQAEEDLVAARLTGPDLSSGFGLRTMSSASGGYSPLSYHCGSVWSHDTAIVIRGLARSGHPAEAAALADGLLDAAAAFGWRLPELFAGDARDQVPWPSAYPASCRPQAWAAAAAGALVQARLGLDVDVPAGRVTVTPPPRRPGGAGPRLHVDGLVAGARTFSAGIDADGAGYVLDPA
jgi:N-terminal domain of (some) glycogen debranching enzymes/Amylo-alpha-1,6-glucosidase